MKFKLHDCIKPSIYFLRKNGEVVYVGSSAFGLYRALAHACINVPKDFDEVELIDCDIEHLQELEAELILRYKPMYNLSMPSSNNVTLRWFRKNYCKGQVTELGLLDLKKLVKQAGLKPNGSFNGETYYDLMELSDLVTTYK